MQFLATPLTAKSFCEPNTAAEVNIYVGKRVKSGIMLTKYFMLITECINR